MIQTHQVKQAILTALASSAVNLDVDGMTTAVIELTGTFVGTVIFEYSVDGSVNWHTLTVTIPDTSTTVTGATAVGVWRANVAGYRKIRVRCTAFTSGEIDVYARAID